MSVVDKVIFCEGKQTSLDIKLIERVLAEQPGQRLTIVSAGGKFTFSVFAQGYFFPDEAVNKRYIIFRDRDFDVQPTSEVKLLKLGQRCFLTHRACIENYLLDADLIHNYWQTKFAEKSENPLSKWGHGDSVGIETITAWIDRSARTLTDYEAVRWALADVAKPSVARSQLETTWTKGSGKLPTSLDLQSCQAKAKELIQTFREAVDQVTQDRFEASLGIYHAKFSQDEFWQQKQYMIWFHGKDLQKAMQQQESQYISLKNFFAWAIEQLDITQYPDLMELRTKIENL
ncbi:hypothetical protein [Coleofasciculus chthonoplastes]|uniref:hypothetical protein n=1 Tax=Coleofasciculus chthonoplastes TaxID=64178 RepID=UPI0032FEBF52